MVLGYREIIKKDAIICAVPSKSNRHFDRQRIT